MIGKSQRDGKGSNQGMAEEEDQEGQNEQDHPRGGGAAKSGHGYKEEKENAKGRGREKTEEAPLERVSVEGGNDEKGKTRIAVELLQQAGGGQQYGKQGRGGDELGGSQRSDKRRQEQQEGVAKQVRNQRMTLELERVRRGGIGESGKQSRLGGVLRRIAHRRESRNPKRNERDEAEQSHQGVGTGTPGSRDRWGKLCQRVHWVLYSLITAERGLKISV